MSTTVGPGSGWKDMRKRTQKPEAVSIVLPPVVAIAAIVCLCAVYLPESVVVQVIHALAKLLSHF
jgi:hypothetical protein